MLPKFCLQADRLSVDVQALMRAEEGPCRPGVQSAEPGFPLPLPRYIASQSRLAGHRLSPHPMDPACRPTPRAGPTSPDRHVAEMASRQREISPLSRIRHRSSPAPTWRPRAGSRIAADSLCISPQGHGRQVGRARVRRPPRRLVPVRPIVSRVRPVCFRRVAIAPENRCHPTLVVPCLIGDRAPQVWIDLPTSPSSR